MKNTIMIPLLASALFSASQLFAVDTLILKPGDVHVFDTFKYKKFNGSFPYNENGEGNISCNPNDRLDTVADFIFKYDNTTKAATLTVSKDASAHKYEGCRVIGLGLASDGTKVAASLESDLPSTIIIEKKK